MILYNLINILEDYRQELRIYSKYRGCEPRLKIVNTVDYIKYRIELKHYQFACSKIVSIRIRDDALEIFIDSSFENGGADESRDFGRYGY